MRSNYESIRFHFDLQRSHFLVGPSPPKDLLNEQMSSHADLRIMNTRDFSPSEAGQEP